MPTLLREFFRVLHVILEPRKPSFGGGGQERNTFILQMKDLAPCSRSHSKGRGSKNKTFDLYLCFFFKLS